MGPNDQYPYYYNGDQSAQPTYPSYQARSPSTNQYQHTRANSGTARQTYHSYQQAQPYENQQSWYGANASDGSQHAAEALSRLGNSSGEQARATGTPASAVGPPYSASGPSNLGYPNVNGQVSGAHLETNTATAPQYQSTVPQNQTQPNYPTASNPLARNQGYAQPRPSSVNSVRSAGMAPHQPQQMPVTENIVPSNQTGMHQYQAQHAQMSHVQRSASPAQIQASHHLQSLSDQRASTSSNQYEGQSSSRTLPIVTQAEQVSAQTYSYGQSSTVQPAAEQYDQPTTIDPSAVYDPWPEYQKRLEAAKATKEAQEAAERAAEEQRIAEEERRQKEAADEEKKKADDARRKAQAKERRKSNKLKATAASASNANDPSGILGVGEPANPTGNQDPEAEIKALMAKVKQMNDKHPTLLAKIWEQERREHLQKATSESPAPQPAPQPTAQLSHAPVTTVNNNKHSPSSISPTALPQAFNGANAQSKVPPAGTSSASKSATKPSKGSTIWPKDKKGQIAASAAKWLNAIPANKDCPIGASKVSEMLDINPTYIELCEMLEKLGIKLERAAFARALLSSVPDVNSGRTPSTIPTSASSGTPLVVSRPASTEPYQPIQNPMPAQVTQNRVTDIQPAAVVRALANHIREPIPGAPGVQYPQVLHNQEMNVAQWSVGGKLALNEPRAYPSPYFDSQGQQIQAQMAPNQISVPPAQKPKPSVENKKKGSMELKISTSIEAKSDRPSEPSASKAEAARKRTFSDIVDLTAMSEDDELPPAKQLYMGPTPITMPGEAYVENQNFLPNFRGLVSPYLQQGAGQWTGQYQNRQQQQQQQQLPHQPGIIDEKLRNVELAKPIDRTKALRRLGYDVTTIARDVLLATGKHPDLLPLNGHLELLKTAFPKQIDYYSDLETVRWDLIDPGDPIPPERTVESGDNDSVLNDADDETDEEVPVTRPVGGANLGVIMHRGVVGADGRTVTMERHTVDSAQTERFKVFKVNKPRGRPPKNRLGDPGLVQSRPSGFGVNNAPEPHQSAHQQHNHRPNQEQSRSNVSSRPINNQAMPSGQGTPARSSHAPSTPGSAPTGPGYQQFTQLGPDGKPIKKKGRPVGWRKNLHQKGVGILAGGSGSSSTMPTNSSGLRNSSAQSKPPEVKYAVYECKWKDCQAKLHNLATLRKHVHKLHGKPDDKGRYTCKWEGCEKMVQVVDPESGEIRQMQQYRHHPDQPLLFKHIEEAHIGPVAWRLGDGPPGGISDSNVTDSEAYLSDARGRRVTPRISALAPSDMPTSAPTSGQRGRPPKKTEEQKARESQAEVAKKKREIGPGVDRGGATLANAKRRAGFIDDEDPEEVTVDDDE